MYFAGVSKPVRKSNLVEMALESFYSYDKFSKEIPLTFADTEVEEEKSDVLAQIRSWHNNELPSFCVAPNSVVSRVNFSSYNCFSMRT